MWHQKIINNTIHAVQKAVDKRNFEHSANPAQSALELIEETVKEAVAPEISVNRADVSFVSEDTNDYCTTLRYEIRWLFDGLQYPEVSDINIRFCKGDSERRSPPPLI